MYYPLNVTVLATSFPLQLRNGVFQGTAVLQDVEAGHLANLMTAQQLSSCHLQFTNKLRLSSGPVLSGATPVFSQGPQLCNPVGFSVAYLKALEDFNALQYDFTYSFFATTAFAGALTLQHPSYSACLTLSDSMLLQDTQQLAAPPDCTDPYNSCCPGALPVSFLYQPCDLKESVLTIFKANDTLIEETCSGADANQCMIALADELGSTKTFATGQPIDKCRGNAGVASATFRTVVTYLNACKDSVLGPLSLGISCFDDSDCALLPGTACMFSSAHSRPQQGFEQGYCWAPAAVIDQLLFQCFFTQMPQFLLSTTALALGFVPTDPAFPSTLFAIWSAPGCGNVFPEEYTSFASSVYHYVTPDASCVPSESCPVGIECFDLACRLPYACSYPFSNCQHAFEPQLVTTNIQPVCEDHFRCNALSLGGSPIDCTSADCPAVCPAGAQFCGHCLASTGECLQMPGSTPAQCPAQACLLPVLNQLTPLGQCQAGQGFCSIPDSFGSHLSTEPECSQRALCTYGPGTSPFTGGFCLGAPSGSAVSCPGSLATPVGCVKIDPVTLQLQVAQANCHGPDPNFPHRNLTWIPIIQSEAGCLANPALSLCFLPFQNQPFFYPNELCDSLGGAMRPVFTWVTGRFRASQVVDLQTIAKQPQPRALWSPFRLQIPTVLTSLSYFGSLSNSVELLSQTLCRQFGAGTTAAFVASCQCVDPITNPAEAALCAPNTEVSTKVASNNAGVGLVCAGMSSVIDFSPVLMFTNLDTTVTTPRDPTSAVVAASITYYSTTIFDIERSRSRATDFYVARQDTEIPPRAVLNSNGNVVGQILSNGIVISDQFFGSQITIGNCTVCISLRPDFVQQILDNPELAIYVSKFQIGVIDADFHNVYPIANPVSSLLYLPGTSPNGTGYDSLRLISAVCNDYEHVPIGVSLVAISTISDPQQVDNGFSAEQDRWIIATGCFYLVPIAFLLLPLMIYLPISRGREGINLNYWCLVSISIFFLLRAVLLFCIAEGNIATDTVGEFALSAFASLALYFSLSLAGFCLYRLMSSLTSNKAVHLGMDRATILTVGGWNLGLLLILVAFLIAVGATDNNDLGISQTYITCYGRVTDHQEFWSTRRIIRFTFSALMTFATLLLSLFLFYLISVLRRANSNPAVLRLIGSNIIAATALLVHSVIALILLATDYNSFAFEIAMLWITEIVPFSAYVVLTTYSMQRQLFGSLTMSTTVGSRRLSTRKESRSGL